MDASASVALPTAPDVAAVVAEAWKRAFGVPADRGDRLLDVLADAYGVDRAVQLDALISEIGVNTGVSLPLTIAYGSPTAADLERMVLQHDWPRYERPVRLQQGTGPSLFVLPGLGGIGLDMLKLLQCLTFPGAVYLNPPRGLDDATPDRTLQAIVADHVAVIRTVQPTGPYWLLGYSWGALVAMGIARFMRASGETIGFVGMIDPVLNEADWTYHAWLNYMTRRLRHHLKELGQLRSPHAAIRYGSQRLVPVANKVFRLFGFNQLWALPSEAGQLPATLVALWDAECEAIRSYRASYYDGAVSLFATRSEQTLICNPALVWPRKVRRLNLQWVPGDHSLSGLTVRHVAAIISTTLASHRR